MLERLDLFLVRRGLARSRRDARDLIAGGRVRVNNRVPLKGDTITETDRVELIDPPPSPEIIPNSSLPLSTLFADPALVIVNKPGLIPCHPLRPQERDTVMNAVVGKYPETALVGDKPLEGGLVHRLDNGTSGALMIARTPPALLQLRTALKDAKIHRVYQAVVQGDLGAQREILTPIAHHPKNSRKMITGANEIALRGRPAATLLRPLARLSEFTLLEVRPRTGSRHQIRVHLASIGHPIAGDTLYGGPPLRELQPGRFWLHLAALDVDSPASGRVHVAAPLPPELKGALGRIRIANPP